MLFVCMGNCVRSQMAEAIARRDAPDVILPESAGLHPLYISPDDLQKFVADAYKMSPEVVALTKKAMGH